jgi:hypothetical protein
MFKTVKEVTGTVVMVGFLAVSTFTIFSTLALIEALDRSYPKS